MYVTFVWLTTTQFEFQTFLSASEDSMFQAKPEPSSASGEFTDAGNVIVKILFVVDVDVPFLSINFPVLS